MLETEFESYYAYEGIVINFKTFLLNESIFNILDSLFANPARHQDVIAAIWMFYRTNQARKGVVALHRFYESDDVAIIEIINNIKTSHPSDFDTAQNEIDRYVKADNLPVVKTTLTKYFSSMQHDADLGPITQRGPQLPRKRIGAAIAPSRQAFGIPSR